MFIICSFYIIFLSINISFFCINCRYNILVINISINRTWNRFVLKIIATILSFLVNNVFVKNTISFYYQIISKLERLMFILRSIDKLKRFLTFDKTMATPQTSTPIITYKTVINIYNTTWHLHLYLFYSIERSTLMNVR